jgi:hypothetical protein
MGRKCGDAATRATRAPATFLDKESRLGHVGDLPPPPWLKSFQRDSRNKRRGKRLT